MACLDMYNQNSNGQHKPLGVGAPSPTNTIGPRISFSNDFVESSTITTTDHSNSHHPQMVRAYRDGPVSSDFEFSLSNYSMMCADELFSQGRLLPLKENCPTNQFQKTTTLRDELLQVEEEEEDDDDDNFSLKPPESSTRWKGFLGLKKSRMGSKKIDKTDGSRSAFAHGEVHSGKPPQEMLNDGGSSSKMKEDQFRL